MADVLLTHSYHLPYDRKQVRKMQPYAPAGHVVRCRRFCSAGRISVAVFDTMLQDLDPGFADALKHHRPRIVVIYEDDFNFLSKMCLTRMRELAWQIGDEARRAGAIVIAHGSDASDQAEDYLRNGVYFVFLGEAEQTLVELCATILLRQPEPGVPGLVYLDSSRHIAQQRPGHRRTLPGTRFPDPREN